MALMTISPYTSWKSISTNSAVPSNSRPDLNASGPHFKAHPINHWRKQLFPNNNSGALNRRSGIGMPMDIPGGSTYLGDNNKNTDCLLNTTTNTTGIKENIVRYNNTNFLYDDPSGCITKTCNPVSKIIKRGTTIINKEKPYYPDMKSYLRARNNLYEQKSTALPVSSITYLDENGKLLSPTNDINGPQVRKTQNCDNNCPNSSYSSNIYKPNNQNFSQQGAVDSSSRITRLKLNTVNKNAASFKTTFGTTAPKYMGTSETPYFLKSKYQVCVPPKVNGRKIKC
jgi:hypothetical protein